MRMAAGAWLFYAILSCLLLIYSPVLVLAEDVESEPTREQLQIQIEILKSELQKSSKYSVAANKELNIKYISAKIKEYEYQMALMDNVIRNLDTQWIASYIVLALVVTIVLSGVFFSWFHLWTAARLDLQQNSHELEISAQKIRITTSIAGITVLLISLAFLYLYAVHIYRITVATRSQFEFLSYGLTIST